MQVSILTVSRRGSCGPLRNEEVDLAPYPVHSLVLQVGGGGGEKRPQELCFESLLGGGVGDQTPWQCGG